MKRRKLFICALLFIFIQPIALNTKSGEFYPYDNKIDVYVGKFDIFEDAFKEVIERLYLVFYDGKGLSITTRHDYGIYIDAWYIRELLRAHNRTLGDVAIMTHNHFARPNLSVSDWSVLKALRRMGFKGSFCIYVTSNQTMKCERYH